MFSYADKSIGKPVGGLEDDKGGMWSDSLTRLRATVAQDLKEACPATKAIAALGDGSQQE